MIGKDSIGLWQVVSALKFAAVLNFKCAFTCATSQDKINVKMRVDILSKLLSTLLLSLFTWIMDELCFV